MKGITILTGSLAIAGAMFLSVPAVAGTFVLTSGSNSSTSGAAGNSKVVVADGITMTATAWSTDNTGVAFLPEAAYLGRYTTGVGVTNNNEGNGRDGNSHVIDNIGSYDFVRLVFSVPVVLTGLSRTAFDVVGGSAVDDWDAWVSYGSTGFGTAALWQGYLNRGVTVPNNGSLSNTNAGTTWLVGAARNDSQDRDDGFKLTSVSAVSAVPEPTTWAMMLVGFGFIGAAMRRRGSSHRGLLSGA
ncbi:PEPxxWA-CTERM sorting domain-containing protein [Sphingomonas sp. M1-B02]|uniref:PEPxxWA-CTERM sorting domain-containing protein n=1 Tax=Sphingomonas sp. M1-B02 TaxID=3114300 RepID=UPI002240BF6E|nr:PEPxxWA-CTERM sorting domain-containing protein [Sphingomonas sp. S6-11]UZK67751.1 PEPxxWA-CTERM sorting domain-containing protein [Sphingomonas sp. S6-11]